MLDENSRAKIADYVKSNAEAYTAWQRSVDWDESYKWKVLRDLSTELSQYSEATDENVDSIIAAYKEHNPTQGSFIHYTYFGDLTHRVYP